MPVAWIYLTAWMTRDDTIQFRNDIYDQDEALDRAGLADAAAGGFVAPLPPVAQQVDPRTVTQSSNLDSR